MEDEVQDKEKNLEENDFMHTDCGPQDTGNKLVNEEITLPLIVPNTKPENDEAYLLEVGVSPASEEHEVDEELPCEKENDFMHTDCGPQDTDNKLVNEEITLPLNVPNTKPENDEACLLEVGVSPASAEHEVDEENIDSDTKNLIQPLTPESNLQTDALTVESKEENCSSYVVINNEKMQPEFTYKRQPCRFDLNATPVQLTGSWGDFETSSENFLKGCKWAPDGTCILTCSDDNMFKLFNLPYELYSESTSCNNLPEMSSVLCMNEGETIYDYCWYPQMSSFDYATCCFISTCRDHPLHLWDAFTGQVRCSYRAYNDLDEITSPHCVAFNLDGSKIFCGFNKMLRVFDTCRAGRQCEKRPTVTKKYGQFGIISCIAFSPDNNGLYACGSFSKSVGIYCEPKGSLMSLVEGHQGGVTHLLFSPDAQRLYSGGRKDNDIICWDMRMPGVVLHRIVRSVTTNQRMYFDLDSSGKYLISGNSDGTVSVWDTTVPPSYDNHLKDAVIPVHLNYSAHDDCVNGVSFHPTLPLLVTASGQRKFVLRDEPDDEETMEYDGGIIKSDSSLRLWQLNTESNTTVQGDMINIHSSNS